MTLSNTDMCHQGRHDQHRCISVCILCSFLKIKQNLSIDGNHSLWLHSTKDNKRIKIKSSGLLEGLAHPFFSPDEKWLAFFVDGKMYRVSTTTKEENIVCDASLVSGGSWGENQIIYFSPHEGSQLQTIDINKSNDPEIVQVNSQDNKINSCKVQIM